DALTACDTPVKTCWELAEKAGHDTPGLFQSLIAENTWDHGELWNRIATCAPRLLPCPADDPLGPGIAVDETAQLKRGHHTVATGIPWAGCVGRKANCVTSVFVSYVTPQAATWIAHGLFLPKKDWFTGTGTTGQARRAAAGVPDETVFETKPQIARRTFQELRDLGVHINWATGDEV
ncbi:MAG: transposase, partial [Actinobacteria bacterium]|nr:transposase [Actinomycetota bacterium]